MFFLVGELKGCVKLLLNLITGVKSSGGMPQKVSNLILIVLAWPWVKEGCMWDWYQWIEVFRGSIFWKLQMSPCNNLIFTRHLKNVLLPTLWHYFWVSLPLPGCVVVDFRNILLPEFLARSLVCENGDLRPWLIFPVISSLSSWLPWRCCDRRQKKQEKYGFLETTPLQLQTGNLPFVVPSVCSDTCSSLTSLQSSPPAPHWAHLTLNVLLLSAVWDEMPYSPFLDCLSPQEGGWAIK